MGRRSGGASVQCRRSFTARPTHTAVKTVIPCGRAAARRAARAAVVVVVRRRRRRPPPSTMSAPLRVFLLRTAEVTVEMPSERREREGDFPETISAAWQAFISPAAERPPSPAPRRKAAVPAAALADGAVDVAFRCPENAPPPPRLAAFALPSWLTADAFDRPRDVSFMLTHASGEPTYGSALQLCEAADGSSGRADDDDGSGAPSGGGGAPRQARLSALVLLSRWPMYELFKTLLHHLHAQRDVLWPVGGGGAALRALLGRASRVLGGCSQELSWLTRHPLWLPTPLAPLFKALRWEAADAAYLLAALLTDQKVILHTHAPPSLFCASCARARSSRRWSSPASSSRSCPPPHVSRRGAHAARLLDAVPHRRRLDAARRAGPPPAAAVIVDLDAGVVQRPPQMGWFDARRPPFAALCAELAGCMGGTARRPFRQVALTPPASASSSTRSTSGPRLPRGEQGARGRRARARACARRALRRRRAPALRPRWPRRGRARGARRAAHVAEGRAGRGVCGGGGGGGGEARGGGGGGGGAARRRVGGGLAEACAVSLADAAPPLRPAADEPVCAALQHVYRSQAFRTWWNAANGPAAAPDRSAQWLQYRAKGLELIEYVRENHATLAQLERSVEERMHAVLAGEDAAAPAEAPVEAAAEAPVEAAAEAPEEAPEERRPRRRRPCGGRAASQGASFESARRRARRRRPAD